MTAPDTETDESAKQLAKAFAQSPDAERQLYESILLLVSKAIDKSRGPK